MRRRTRRSLWRRSLWIWAWAAALPLVAAGCGDRDAVPAELGRRPATPVRVESVQASRFARALTVPGIVEAEARIELAFRVGGFVERFHVDEGDRVESGAVLAELDREDLEREARMARAALARAEAEAKRTSLDHERQLQLFEARSTSRQRLDETRAARDVAHARLAESRLALEAAEDRLEKAVLQAPITGYVEERRLEVHERAAAEVPVLVLTQLDTVAVRAAVADSAVSMLKVGGPATVHLGRERGAADSRPGELVLEGTISRVAVAADPATRTVPFEVRVANPDLALRPRTVVTVEIREERNAPSHSVPLASVLRGVDLDPFCFVVVEAEGVPRAERRAVRLGTVFGDRVTVVEGLAAGDRVVTRGQHFLQEGDPIQLVEGGTP